MREENAPEEHRPRRLRSSAQPRSALLLLHQRCSGRVTGRIVATEPLKTYHFCAGVAKSLVRLPPCCGRAVLPWNLLDRRSGPLDPGVLLLTLMLFGSRGFTFPPRVVDLGNRPTRKRGKRLVTKTPRMRPVLAPLSFAQQESDQFFEALLNVHGLQRSGIGFRGLRLDQTQACAGRPGFRFHWLRLPNGYGFKRLRHVIIHLLSHCGLRCGVSRPGAFIGRWSPGSERGRNVGLQVQVLGVPLTRDQLARAVAGREANREQNKYDEEPNHQTIRAHS